ncbi:MAG: hypothetical protein AAB403_16515 [Planctomycetota bacterium]
MKQFRNHEMAEAFGKWLEEARAFLRDKPPKSEAAMDPGTRLVIHHEPGRSVEEEVVVPESPSHLLYDHREEIPNLTSYRRVVDVLRRSFASTELTGKFVGTAAGASLAQSGHFPELFIHNYWLRNRSLDYDETSFAEVYATLESFIYADELVRTLNAPLHNFDSEVDTMTFGEGLSARVITPELYESLYLRGGTFKSENKTEHRGLRSWLLTVRTTEVKMVRGEHDPPRVDEAAFNQPYRLAQDLIKALRIYKKGAPTFRFVDEETPWAHVGGRAYPALTLPRSDPLILSADELDDFRNFFTTFRKVDLQRDRFLRVAIERFNSALDRITLEDSVIDLSICLEALLLSGLGNEDDRGNVSYRFALHGARLLGQDAADRQQVYHKLKGVYGVRSRIVHGAESYDLPREESGKKITIDRFCDSLEQLARACFRKFFCQFERTGDTCRIEWNTVVLS